MVFRPFPGGTMVDRLDRFYGIEDAVDRAIARIHEELADSGDIKPAD